VSAMSNGTRLKLYVGLVGAWLGLSIGCSGQQHYGAVGSDISTKIELSDTPTALVMDAVRDTLMEYRFAIDRVDARRGVVTTHPKRTAGLASPWDQEQSSLNQEWEDLFNEQRRVVRVELGRDASAAGVESVNVTVEVLRTSRPGWRVESESVRLSTHARSRGRDGELLASSSREVVGLDTPLAQRLVEAIESRLSSGAVGP
jgi:hypothetical protein